MREIPLAKRRKNVIIEVSALIQIHPRGYGQGGFYMILAIDIGNSTFTTGLFDDSGKLLFVSTLETSSNKTSDQCAIDLLNLFQLNGFTPDCVHGAILSSVVPPITANVAAAIQKLFGISAMVIGPGIKTGLNNKTEIHTQLGSHIVTSSVAALKKYKPPIIVIDMGTATTISLIDSKGAFAGCAILPGVRLALEALSERAAQLPHISIGAPESIIGKNTVDSMCAGVVFGNAAALDGMIARFEEEIGTKAAVVACGGCAPSILPYCKSKIDYDETLLLDGLYTIFQKNRERFV